MVPKKESGHTAVRFPVFNQQNHRFFILTIIQFFNRIDHSDIAYRKYIRRLQRKHQINITRPVADAFDFD